MKGSNLIQLSNLYFNSIINHKDFYYDNGNHFAITNEYVKESIIAKNWGLLWVKENIYQYQDSTNRIVCEKVARTLMESGKINEFKTKSLINILKNINSDLQQEIINYILMRKESKELAMIGLVLIDKGYEKGWNDEAFKSFYKFRESAQQLASLYKINENYDYSIDDLLEISKFYRTILNKNDINKVNEYNNDCESIRKSMRLKIGEISLSGIREKYGKLQLDEDIKKFRKFMTTILAHFDKDILSMNLDQLRHKEKQVDEFYELYKVICRKWQTYEQTKL